MKNKALLGVFALVLAVGSVAVLPHASYADTSTTSSTTSDTSLTTSSSTTNQSTSRAVILTAASNGMATTTSSSGFSGISINALSNNGIGIGWTTDASSNSQIFYGPTTAYGSSILNGMAANNHMLNLTGLTAGQQYHFQIVSTDASGNVIRSADQVFTAPGTPSSSMVNANNTTATNTTTVNGSATAMTDLDIRYQSILQALEQQIATLRQQLSLLIALNTHAVI